MLAGVSRETLARLDAFEALVRRWSPRINLVSSRDLAALRHRHSLDSAQLLAHAPSAARNWVDLGSGGGFPGIVIAILAAEHRPSLRMTLVESDQRKSVFLRTAVRELALRVDILTRRIEAAAPPARFDVVSARALAPLPRLVPLAAPWCAEGGIFLFPKGESVEEELTAAAGSWHIAFDRLPSATAPGACILKITELRPVRRV